MDVARANDLSLFDAIEARQPLHALQSIVRERPESVRVRPNRSDRYVEGSTALHWAARQRLPVESVRFLYYAWPQALREGDWEGGNPIHWLVDPRNVGVGAENDDGDDDSFIEVAKFLVGQWPNALQQPNQFGQYPIHKAAANASLPPELFQFLVERTSAAQLRQPGGLGHLPIHFAAMLDADPESIHEKDCDGKTPLHHAASGYSVSLVQFLVERGALPLERDDMGRVPLHWVAERSDEERREGDTSARITRALIDACPESVRVRGNDGRLPLHLAAEMGVVGLVRVLVGAWPESVREADEDGRVALHRALASDEDVPVENRLETARFLFEEWPGSIRERDRTGQTLVHMVAFLATKMDGPGLVLDFLNEHIREYHQVQDQQGQLPLHLVEVQEMAVRLVDAWPPAVRVQDRLGRLPLHVALARATALPPARIRGDNTVWLLNAARALAEAWPDSLLVPDQLARLPLHLLAAGSGIAVAAREVVEVARFIVEARPRALQARDRQGRLPLHVWAAQRNPSLEAADLLVQPWPESLLVADHEGRLPLHVILERKHASLDGASLLVDPASVRIRDNQEHLQRREMMDMASLLTDGHSISLQVRDHQGRHPLLVAATIPDPSLDMVRLLVEACPLMLQLLDPQGLVPVQVAAAHDAPLDVVYYLARQRPDLLRSHEMCCAGAPSSSVRDSSASALRPRKQARR
jgi:ankyrin repeat protein